ncbi:hypothetical protein R1F58_23440, partial [Klebsiella sp. 125182]
MSHQLTFADSEFSTKRRQTRKEIFLSRMEQILPWQNVVVKFFWTRRSDGRVMHRRATGRQGWPAFRTVRVIGSQVLNA